MNVVTNTFREHDISLLLKAVHFAADKHKNQQRKNKEGEPYINHLVAVAEILWEVGKISDVMTLVAGIPKWVLYLSVLEEGDRIEPEHIQQQLYEKDRRKVDIATIRDVLIRLSRGDLLEYMELGGWFRKVDDPIRLDFLKVWGQFEVEGRQKTRVVEETITLYKTLQRQVNDHKGYLAEIFMAQILWNGQRKTFPGACFPSSRDITLPHSFL